MKRKAEFWSYDSIHSVQMYLISANEMWTAQVFSKATPERTAAILAKCRQAQEKLDEIIANLEEEADKA
jgi:hypothetical protein